MELLSLGLIILYEFMGNVRGSNLVTKSPVTLIIDIVPLAKGEMRGWQTGEKERERQ